MIKVNKSLKIFQISKSINKSDNTAMECIIHPIIDSHNLKGGFIIAPKPYLEPKINR